MDFDENTFARLIDRAGGDDAPRPEHGQQLRRQALAVFDRAQAEATRPTFLTHSLANWRWIMRFPVSRIAAAAVFVFAIAGVALWFHVSGTQYAFAEFIKPILEAKSAKFKATFERNGKQVATANCMVLAPNRDRMELQQLGQPMEIQIADTSKGVGVMIDSAKKTVVINKVVGLSRERASMNPFDEIRSLILDAEKPDVRRESLGEKEVDGRRAVGWRVSGPGLHEPGVTVTIWGDPQTGLPIRIESYSSLDGVKSTLSDFAFNVDLDESLFSIEPPTGYTVQTVEVDASQPTEKDLIAVLREYGKWMNNAFPESLDWHYLNLTLQACISIELRGGGEVPVRSSWQDCSGPDGRRNRAACASRDRKHRKKEAGGIATTDERECELGSDTGEDREVREAELHRCLQCQGHPRQHDDRSRYGICGRTATASGRALCGQRRRARKGRYAHFLVSPEGCEDVPDHLRRSLGP